MTQDTMTTFTVTKKNDEGADAPARIVTEILFTDDCRRITPRDLEDAARAMMIAGRASLEGRKPAYSIASIKCQVEYLYVQARRTLKG